MKERLSPMHRLPSKSALRQRSRTTISALALSLVILSAFSSQAKAAAPSSGSVLQQITPPPAALAPPGPVLVLPPVAAQPSQSDLLIPVSKLMLNGNALLSDAELHRLIAPAEGRKLTLGQLQAYVDQITQDYHAHGYPIAYAYLPPQSIRDGVVNIVVVEPKYDQVTVTGKSRFTVAQALRTVGIKPGEPVAAGPLNHGLLLLGQTPGVVVKGTLIPGAAPGTSTLQIMRHDLPLFTANFSENNYGNRYTGSYLSNATVTANDPFGYGSSISVNAITSQTAGLKAGGFNVLSPDIWNGVRAGVYGSSTFYRLGGTFKNLRQVGRETQFGGDLTDPVILQPGAELDVRFDALSDWLAQSTRSTGTDAQQQLTIERFTIDGVRLDDLGGVTSGSISLSHGDLAIAPGAAKALDAAGPNARGGYLVGQLLLSRSQALPAGFTLTGNFNGQISDKNLDSSQQLYLGGPYGVMSYQVGDGGGDEGYLLTMRLSHALPVPMLPGALSASLLAQTGTVRVNHTLYKGFSGSNQITESGLGVGLDYNWGIVSVSLAYAHQLGANATPTVSRAHDQFWFDVNLAL
jgi:hemolysin activation/secretion protein